MQYIFVQILSLTVEVYLWWKLQLMKNGGKNKSVTFIILVSVYLNMQFVNNTHTHTHTHTHTVYNMYINWCPKVIIESQLFNCNILYSFDEYYYLLLTIYINCIN